MERLEERVAGRVLVLFDGYCALCNGVVRWLIRRDRLDRLRFAPAERFEELLTRNAIPFSGQLGTIVAVKNFGVEDERVLTHSAAILMLMGELKKPWPWVAGVLGVIPKVVRDFFYRVIARNRFRIWKRLASCPVPSEEERRHFLY